MSASFYLVLTLIEFACVAWLLRVSFVAGKHRGYKRGYESGRVDAEKWWLEQGAAVSKEREKIQKEQERWP